MNIICRIKVHFSDSATYRWINIAVPPFAETGLYKKKFKSVGKSYEISFEQVQFKE